MATLKGAFRLYNAAAELLERNLLAGRGDKVVFIDRSGQHTFAELDRRVNQFANLLVDCGIGMEERVLLCLLDTIDFPVCFLGAIKAGAVPVPVNTQLTADDYAYLIADSRARALVVSVDRIDSFRSHLTKHPTLRRVFISDAGSGDLDALHRVLPEMSDRFAPAPTRPDDAALWLYTSGTTGRPKAAVHVQTDLHATAELFAKPVLNVTEDDLIFSAPKLFFAFGLGNSLTFPLATGAAAVLMAERPTVESVKRVLDTYRPSIFFGVPTLYAMLLNKNGLPEPRGSRLRACVSAGEALPAMIWERWRSEVGLEIFDGIGSTEMLHTFMSNSPGDVRAGTSGKPLAGYEVRLLDEDGREVADGQIGDLYVSGPTSAIGYWNLRSRSQETFRGRWTRTGDKYYRDPDGYYVYCGRSDDLLKVGGIYVSPLEVEGALLSHPAVADAAVVGKADADDLIKPKAFVVVRDGVHPSDELAGELINHVRAVLADYKRPRWVEFVQNLPKTVTGKTQRFKLREAAPHTSAR